MLKVVKFMASKKVRQPINFFRPHFGVVRSTIRDQGSGMEKIKINSRICNIVCKLKKESKLKTKELPPLVLTKW
jgi:hypothetical protein